MSELLNSPHCDVEATLLHFILDMASPIAPHVAQHFAQHILQRVVAHQPTSLTRRGNSMVSVVADIKGSAVEMTAVLGGVSVIVPQFRHIFLCAEDTRHDELMQGNALDLQTVVIGSSYIAEQYGSSGNQIRNTSVQYIHMIIR